MPVQLVTRQEFRRLKQFDFCYLCGAPLATDPEIDEDHVPPTGIFAVGDRDFPLILPTHKRCNSGRSHEDQAAAQLIGLLHGRPHPREHLKLKFYAGATDEGRPLATVTGVDLRGIIRRWVRGFHAALYEAPLPPETRFATRPPLHEARVEGDSAIFQQVDEVVAKLVEEIRRNRLTRTLDRIECRNGKCRYECVWAQSDVGRWICIYALDVYGWSELGDVVNFERLGCVGCYEIGTLAPPHAASLATRLHFSPNLALSLDPFAR